MGLKLNSLRLIFIWGSKSWPNIVPSPYWRCVHYRCLCTWVHVSKMTMLHIKTINYQN